MERIGSRARLSVACSDAPSDCVKVALINNMPDAALEDTESQFFELLDSASGDVPVQLRLYSLPDVPRSDRARERLNNLYSSTRDLVNHRYDGVIITGTEPRQPDLRNEPYWPSLVEVFDWAAQNTVSTVLSCLAAHAGVLHSDGIGRHPLPEKRFGVFNDRKVCDHALTSQTAQLMPFPHSRWNEVRGDELVACGYVVLTNSAESGVNLFVKKRMNSLVVHFQGHPEYTARTLMKEYRRDVKRFLRGERETYPSMPEGYFDATASKLLNEFRENAVSRPEEELLAGFPERVIADTLESSWHSAATRVYQNWLQYVACGRADRSACTAVARVG
jgi:homoserine O-succinyltransferase